ncbi:hypothetical protein acsn021_23520 [Anaerocolumna cellulosilytica]|uniref:Uncharacterized protein n=1 Tax=Anaerocolumna cellulosilytica TaxID=433286 RepID=A0A6S6QU00_9FIRM|nr:hypothetical protein [Anaerocolumna cellulosilytica]MBB5194003.1 hypothetical protein [Anaerocolumna cellulosilytica]BCJ94783.1 hypothetical protein acsn021_23520 [Anaerocolumna cellulosilytica]
MIRKKIVKTIILAMCLSLLSAGGALAETKDLAGIVADKSIKAQVIDESLVQLAGEDKMQIGEDAEVELMATSGMLEEAKFYKTTFSVKDTYDTKNSGTLPVVIVGIGGVVVLLLAIVYVAERKKNVD